ncbi:MAG: tetratricopeptide repeat protein [Gammaproteobacteria bacterium]|nr:tetratricopeptide repeat protein [Gammaproteobacteria bacterium]NNL63273.1 tetratricopeptide repeat protein [Woeseiaceae bacterium]
MTFWLILVVLCLAAIAFAALPLWKSTRRLSPLIATVIVFTVGASAALYNQIGSPGVPSGRASEDLPGMEDAIASLRSRLAENPEDAEGWSLLGRTYMSLGNFGGAVEAYETAMDIEGANRAQTMVDLAVAILNRDQSAIEGRTASLIESALALEPNNQPALFYSGVAAANRGDTDTAASRWEILLGLNPPDNVRSVLEQGIAEWRGEAPPAPAAQPVAAAEAAAQDGVVSARITLSDEAVDAMKRDANVFIIARDPAAPSPPIAVTRRLLSELPTVVSLSDAESMVEGRNLSMFAEIELLARVSLSGSPAAASGDWFGSILVRPAENASVFLTIDQQIP